MATKHPSDSQPLASQSRRGIPFMLMLHISDIHFKSPDCLDQWMDPDFPIRTRFVA
jgi:hypothetical protein